MMGKLPVVAGLSWSDRVAPLITGEIRPEGMDLNVITAPAIDIFRRMLHHKEFTVSEMSLASFTIQVSRGVTDFIAIPVFLSRMFRHSAVYVRRDRVSRPEDLNQKRIGVPEYQMTAAVWVRHMLKAQYGIDPINVKWFTGGLNEPGPGERIPLQLTADVSVTPIGPSAALNDMIEAGEIDALISPKIPNAFGKEGSMVERLFPDFKKAEMEYFTKTNVLPIMHTVAIRRDAYEANRWMATELFNAFEKAKDLALSRIQDTDTLAASLVWLPSAVLEEQTVFGSRDTWPYGIDKNKSTLDGFMTALRDQGLIGGDLALEDLFAKETL